MSLKISLDKYQAIPYNDDVMNTNLKPKGEAKMTTLATLKKQALESCKFRGHSMGRFRTCIKNQSAWTNCGICGKQINVDTAPLPNGIEIGGEAVALSCEV